MPVPNCTLPQIMVQAYSLLGCLITVLRMNGALYKVYPGLTVKTHEISKDVEDREVLRVASGYFGGLRIFDVYGTIVESDLPWHTRIRKLLSADLVNPRSVSNIQYKA
jgi:hypothetical protein